MREVVWLPEIDPVTRKETGAYKPWARMDHETPKSAMVIDHALIQQRIARRFVAFPWPWWLSRTRLD